MKKTALILSIILILGMFAACGKQPDTAADNTTAENTAAGSKISIVATIFPIYDWVRNICGEENADITLLLDKGVDLHSYQPTADDIVKINESDVFIYVGGESDSWAEDIIGASSGRFTAVSLMEELGDKAKAEELKEGMEAEEEEEEDAQAAEEEEELDEHVWLSLKNAAFLCSAISEKICAADPANADTYKANTAAYIEKINELEGRYEKAAASAKVKTLLFGDRFPFRYLVDDCGLDYYAAFAGCSAESEASFETVAFLAAKTDELGLSYVMATESSDGRLAEAVINATASKSAKVLVLDSLQSDDMNDVNSGKTYLSAMENNLEVLKTALSAQ